MGAIDKGLTGVPERFLVRGRRSTLRPAPGPAADPESVASHPAVTRVRTDALAQVTATVNAGGTPGPAATAFGRRDPRPRSSGEVSWRGLRHERFYCRAGVNLASAPATKRSPDLPTADDPLAADARAGVSHIRANADRPTDEKQKRVHRRRRWLLPRRFGTLTGRFPAV